MKYYVQEIAQNYLKNLPDGTEAFKVHPMYLHGFSEDGFKDGYAALIQFMRDFYTDIISDPASFDMPLIDTSEGGEYGVDYTKSHAGFVRVPRLLLVIGRAGTLEADMLLSITGKKFNKMTKQLQITGTTALLRKFADYGFEISGFSKKINDTDEITIGYPDCRALIAVLKSMAQAHKIIKWERWYKDIEHFYIMTPKLIESKTPRIKFGFEYLYRCLNKKNRKIAKALHDFVAGNNRNKVKVIFAGFMRNIWTCSYTGGKTKKTIMLLKSKQDNLLVKLNLENINEYTDVIKHMPEHILEIIHNSGHQCKRSHQCFPKCIEGFVFEMDGITYKRCRVSAFWFNDLSGYDIPHIKKLLELEMRREK